MLKLVLESNKSSSVGLDDAKTVIEHYLSSLIYVYGRLPKSSNTLNIRTLKIIAKYNFKMFPKISNSG